MSVWSKITPVLLFGCVYTGVVSPAYALTPDEENTISVYRRTHTGVVNITNQAVSYDFFLRPVPSEASGSGSVLDKEGHILTNYHVVKGAQRLTVTLSDGSSYPAQLVGADPLRDIALLKVDAPPSVLDPVPFGDSSKLQVGQKVLAIGNPFGLEQSLSTGVISCIRKVVQAGNVEIEDVIQTDAAINPGNSGGPLLDSDGRLIGVNTAIFTPSGGNVGIGFAIPANTVRGVLDDLLKQGYVTYGFLGAQLDTVTPRYAQLVGLPMTRGAVVMGLGSGSPAERAGLQPGRQQRVVGNMVVVVGADVITAANGESIETADELIRIVQRQKPGEVMSLKVYRDGKYVDVKVQLGERPRR